MQDLKIALVQADQQWEDKKGNYATYERLLEGVSEADLIVLPEMFSTGFSMNAAALAETMEDEAVGWLKKLAREKQSAVYTSFIFHSGSGYFNRGAFVFPDGKIETYDKRKRFVLAKEHEVFESGESESIVEFKGWKINLQICYDLRFPEISRNGYESDGKAAYDLLVYTANWPERRIVHWSTLLKARAIENQCYVAGCNRVGKDGEEISYNGCSAVIDPLGAVESQLEEGEAGIVYAEISMEKLLDNRSKFPFLKDSDYRSLK